MFTVSLDLTSDLRIIAEGVTNALDDLTNQIRTLEGGELFEFTPFVRFGEYILLLNLAGWILMTF